MDIYHIEIFTSPEGNFLEKNIVAIIGLLLVILTYLGERISSAKRAKKNNKYNWFLSIIIQPNLERIEKIYSSTEETLKKSINELRTSSSLPHDQYLLLQRKKMNQFKNEKRSYFNNFSSLVRAYDPNLANRIDEIINELDDIYTQNLDEGISDESKSFSVISSEIYRNQTTLYANLFEEINLIETR
ncbi:hypothetical protein [Autumnicola psychrophila]|uniref:Uncharacterized protein n=1 Tax=Autumnicola psychrophila TaxID=3075592 RepID=A0ABU3DVB3_9FLAO|nr:hypothetical protein [Zunongwangia sp. F225]MDT0687665.1 hypothetical protein [Zunongwangia sp. F225]